MSDTQTSPIAPEGLDEFIRQLFVCHWVLGQMIAGMLERARSGQHDADQAPTDDAYTLVRGAIREVVDRHGAQQIEAATKLIDEVMDAISDDRRIFPPEPPVTMLADRASCRRPGRGRRR
jgi:hypothetical protein